MICRECKAEKPEEAFAILKGKYRRHTCESCRNKTPAARRAQAKYRDEHRDVCRNRSADYQQKNPGYDRRWRYGITQEEYDKKFADQNGMCAICRKPPKHRKALCLDHDHRTGKNRGLLCGLCNTMLGRFDDDPTKILAAVEYLRRYTNG